MTFSFELSNSVISVLFVMTFVCFLIAAHKLDKLGKRIKELEKGKAKTRITAILGNSERKMPLREEIKAICQGLNYEVTMESCDEETDQIIKLFEKVIDEKMAECRKESFAESDEVIGILEQLKEELKK